MDILPKTKFKFLFSSLFTTFVILALPASALAASAYISPATGLIKDPTFKVSVYVESSTGEPEIAGTTMKITYPTNVNVTSINNGDFDSYLEKTYDDTTRMITVNAINNAGNYKSGKVKVASINFDTAANTGNVQLTIDPSSSISGAGGEQLLTETINGVYTLEVTGATVETEVTTVPTTVETTPAVVPETGINNVATYVILSTALIGLGLLVFANPLGKNNGT